MARTFRNPNKNQLNLSRGSIRDQLNNMNDADDDGVPTRIGYCEFLVNKHTGEVLPYNEGMAGRSDILEPYDRNKHGPLTDEGERLDAGDRNDDVMFLLTGFRERDLPTFRTSG